MTVGERAFDRRARDAVVLRRAGRTRAFGAPVEDGDAAAGFQDARGFGEYGGVIVKLVPDGCHEDESASGVGKICRDVGTEQGYDVGRCIGSGQLFAQVTEHLLRNIDGEEFVSGADAEGDGKSKVSVAGADVGDVAGRGEADGVENGVDGEVTVAFGIVETMDVLRIEAFVVVRHENRVLGIRYWVLGGVDWEADFRIFGLSNFRIKKQRHKCRGARRDGRMRVDEQAEAVGGHGLA